VVSRCLDSEVLVEFLELEADVFERIGGEASFAKLFLDGLGDEEHFGDVLGVTDMEHGIAALPC